MTGHCQVKIIFHFGAHCLGIFMPLSSSRLLMGGLLSIRVRSSGKYLAIAISNEGSLAVGTGPRISSTEICCAASRMPSIVKTKQQYHNAWASQYASIIDVHEKAPITAPASTAHLESINLGSQFFRVVARSTTYSNCDKAQFLELSRPPAHQ